MRRRGPLLIGISIVLALMAAWVANKWLLIRATGPTGAPQEQVVVASMDIPLGTRLESRHLAMMEVASGKAPRDSFHSYDDVVGKVVNSSVLSGEILLTPRITDSGAGSALASVVSSDMRAVTVRVDDVVGVAGFLLPGNRVDVIATEKNEATSQVKATTILSNVKVLAVDQSASADSNQPVLVHAVTLEVSPADAETLLKGKTAGAIQLTLRNPLDKSDTRVVALAPPPPKPIPKKPVPEVARVTPTITVIRGTQVAHASPGSTAQSE